MAIGPFWKPAFRIVSMVTYRMRDKIDASLSVMAGSGYQSVTYQKRTVLVQGEGGSAPSNPPICRP